MLTMLKRTLMYSKTKDCSDTYFTHADTPPSKIPPVHQCENADRSECMHTCIRGCFACEPASLSSIQVLSTLTLRAHEHVDINNPLKDSPMKWICCSPMKWLALCHFIGTTAVICTHHIHDMVGFHFIIFRLGCPKTFYKLPPFFDAMLESREELSFYKFGIFKFAESFSNAFSIEDILQGDAPPKAWWLILHIPSFYKLCRFSFYRFLHLVFHFIGGFVL